MKIIYKSLAAGPNGVHQPGKPVEVSKADGDAAIEGKFAVSAEAELPPADPPKTDKKK